MPELPRITRALRIFTQLGRSKKSCLQPNDLIKKRKERIDQLESNLTYTELCKRVPRDALPYIMKLRQWAATICKDKLPEVIDDFTVFTLCLLIDEQNVTNNNFEKLRQIVRHITLHVVTKAIQIIKEIRTKLDKESLNLLREVGGKVNNDNNSIDNIFEKKFVYSHAKVLWPDTGMLHDMCVGNVTPNTDNFSMAYNHVATEEKKEFDKATFIKGLKDSNPTGDIEELKNLILSKLSNSQNIQTELVDMLGCNHFDYIQYLIKHKNTIITTYTSPKLSKQQQSHQNTRNGPIISGQVTVQSEDEKKMKKQFRKTEKKWNKLCNKRDIRGEANEFELDTSELQQKHFEVLTASNAPIFKKPVLERSYDPKEYLPFVFDSKLTKNINGCVSGQKVMLPKNVIRENNEMCEEIHIPIPESEPLDVGNDLVPIEALDEIGQKAFSGMKTLNRIQSKVFNAAYQTNENLLICAPTGAGKTNIALLTIIHQLKQYIEHGELMKDQFKIIYIAPMKALAAEMTANFSRRLSCLGVCVRELTGDMQLTKSEIQQTQMIVTTPEKWDVVTRKGTGDVSLASIVKLLIIDEVHLLHGDRGPVVEALVARTLRQIESSQRMIRIIGLSATLPNYIDVATFLRVNIFKGLFYFDHRFRPVPLSQTFIGVKQTKLLPQNSDMDLICYNKVVDMVKQGHQVMVFVHTRNGTVKLANVLKELAMKNETQKFFLSNEHAKYVNNAFNKSRSKHLIELFNSGLSVHHAGLLRSDRNLVEKYFAQGLIKVLVCTSTLAWGVNLPAHAVIIRGTEIYDSKHGSFIDLSILDVLQIFGRAGRPQFDKSGHAVIITTHDKLSHYLSALTNQVPIESSFITYLADNLNAEITLGTVSNIEEAIEWLTYTYLFVRMRLNPLAYGIPYDPENNERNLQSELRKVIDSAAKALDKAKMIRYNFNTGDLNITDLGRIASYFYLKYDTVEIFNNLINPVMDYADIFNIISQSHEFQQLKVREEEMEELHTLQNEYCELHVSGGKENTHGKVNILLQTYLCRGQIKTFSLISDQGYIIQNAIRICRALFEIMLRQSNAIMAGRLLDVAKMLERQQWDFATPLRQFNLLPSDIITKIEERGFTVEKLQDMQEREIGDVLRNQRAASLVKKCCNEIPAIEIESSLQPITRTILRIRLKITPQFYWNDKIHGKTSQTFWIWIEDPENNFIYHHEYFTLTKKMVCKSLPQELVMTIPLTEPLPSQYLVKAASDYWIHNNITFPLLFHNLILPDIHPPHTDLLELQPLPVSALKDSSFEKLYKFNYFNPVQTQFFHCLYHTDNNVLLGAPTGSGKTIAAEIAMFRVFKQYPDQKVVYIAPLKALVRERIKDWKERLEEQLGKQVVELTGDVTPDIKALNSASVIVTTPEKWDGISRSWQTRSYVQKVALIVIDEIHLLGEDRGPVLEVIISRTNFISSYTSKKLRIVGLSTALANAVDLANWLGIDKMGLYNFRPSVRPVTLEIHINGFPGKHYCPRMATMNRPTFQAIRQHAPNSPSLVFVSSRRQTRLTALDLIAYLAGENNSKLWLHMPEEEIINIIDGIKDSNLKLTLMFGIGLHHAGLQDKDRRIVEELFVNNKIQVLITTATLAWGVNFPAHLVVIKGTEYYDGKTKRYVDMPITDVLQMIGRAGRPQFDTSGVAVVLVHDLKKDFYKKFLHEPFPVESSLLAVLPDHINAEIVAGTIKNKQEFLNYMTWTYFFRRLLKNPQYYNLDALEPQNINMYLSGLVEDTVRKLTESHCIGYDDMEQILYPLPMGKIASFYYLSHQTMLMFEQKLEERFTVEQYLRILSNSYEYNELPVRHNEELLNEELAKLCRYSVDQYTYDSPNTKAFLLLQAYFSRLSLPCADYITDLKSVLDQSIRICQAMIDTVAEHGWLASTISIIHLLQMIIQARWIDEPAVLTLPYIDKEHLNLFDSLPIILPKLCAVTYNNYNKLLHTLIKEFTEEQIHRIHQVIKDMPVILIDLALDSSGEDGTESIEIQLQSTSPQVIEVCVHQECTLVIGMKRENRSSNLRAHCPKFQKGKDEGWFLILGDISQRELWALKRASGINNYRKTQQLQFTAPSTPGLRKLTFYLISDCYIGLDQQYDVHLRVTHRF